MTVFLGASEIVALASDELVLEAARAAVEAERRGATVLPTRMEVEHDCGFLRVMPALLEEVMGLKVMTLARELGTRYVILLHEAQTGELLALLDAEEVTRLRTAATTALAGDMLCARPPQTIGLIGSGFEAEGHLRLLARHWGVQEVEVFSRSAPRRERFATLMSEELGIAVRAASTCERACAHRVVVLATKSEVPVVDGDSFQRDSVVLSIGSTRPDLRELDRRTLMRTSVLLVDSEPQVGSESGDVIDALAQGALTSGRIVGMPRAMADPGVLRRERERDLLTFKSVGTALQDLALARAIVAAASADGGGRELGELARLKPFAAARHVGVEPTAPRATSP